MKKSKQVRTQKELLKNQVKEIYSLDEIANENISSRKVVKFKCNKCQKYWASMIVNIFKKKRLICKNCETEIAVLNTYGVKNGFLTSKAKENIEKKYGCKSYSKTKEFKERMKQLSQKRYGTDWITESDYFKDKSRQTVKDRYGVDYITQDPEFISNSLKTRYERYKDVSFNRKYFYKNLWFDSSWELAYYIWLTDLKVSFEYHPDFNKKWVDEQGKDHRYYPDFLVEGEYQEIKGNQFFNDQDEPYDFYQKKFWWKKYNFLKENNIKIIRFPDIKDVLKYIAHTYGKKYLASFKKTSSYSETKSKAQEKLETTRKRENLFMIQSDLYGNIKNNK